MWETDESVSVRGARCTALISRRAVLGVHMYPTATLRMPIDAEVFLALRQRITELDIPA